MDTLGRSYHIPKDPNGVLKITPHRLDVLQFIHRFPYAPSHYIDYALGTDLRSLRAELFTKGYATKHIKAYHAGEGSLALMPKNSWSLTKKGEATLINKRPTLPFIPKGRFTDHQLYSTMIGMGLLFGAREEGLGFGFTEDLLRQPVDDHAFSFKAPGFSPLTADARPFKLTYNGKGMFFWGFEADRKTESLNSESQNSIINKFRRYEAMLDARHYETIGLPNVNVMFITISPKHLERIIELFKNTVDPAWHKNFWFTSYPDAAPHLDFPPPSGRVLTGDWYTAGGRRSPVSFLKGSA